MASKSQDDCRIADAVITNSGTRRRQRKTQYTGVFSSDEEECLITQDIRRSGRVSNSIKVKQSQNTEVNSDEEEWNERGTRKKSQEGNRGKPTSRKSNQNSGTHRTSQRLQSQVSSDEDEDLYALSTRRSRGTISQRRTRSQSQNVEVDTFLKFVRRKIELHNLKTNSLDKKQISYLMEELDNTPKLLEERKYLMREVSNLKKDLLSINGKLDLVASTLKVANNTKSNLYKLNTTSTSLENFDLSLLTNNDFVTPSPVINSNDNQYGEYSEHFSVKPNWNKAKILQNIKLCDYRVKSENLFDSQPGLSKEIYTETPLERSSPKSEVFEICTEVKNIDICKTILTDAQEFAASSQDTNINLSDVINKLEVQKNESSDTYKVSGISDDDGTIVDMEIEPDKNDAEDKHLLVHNKLRDLSKKSDLDESDFRAVMDDLHLLIKDLRGELVTKFKELEKKCADETVEEVKSTGKSLFPEVKDKSRIIIKSGEKITEEDYEKMVEKLSVFYTLPENKLFEIKQEEVTEMPNWEDFESFN